MICDEFTYTFKVIKQKNNNINHFEYNSLDFEISIPDEHYGFNDCELDNNDNEIKNEDYDYHAFSMDLLFKKLEESIYFKNMEYDERYYCYIRGELKHSVQGNINKLNIVRDIDIIELSYKYIKLTKIFGYDISKVVKLNNNNYCV